MTIETTTQSTKQNMITFWEFVGRLSDSGVDVMDDVEADDPEYYYLRDLRWKARYQEYQEKVRRKLKQK